jgi:hypothetical protein
MYLWLYRSGEGETLGNAIAPPLIAPAIVRAELGFCCEHPIEIEIELLPCPGLNARYSERVQEMSDRHRA